MNKYIFDLDLTLYSENDYTETDTESMDYDSFKQKNFLKQLLGELNGNKYILTNANLSHASLVLDKTNLMNVFEDIISSDMVNSYKPYRIIYDTAIREFKVQPNENVYFFEDQVDNLKTAKNKYNWNTVLITPEKTRKNKHVDYKFDTIEDAVLFFIVKDKLNLKQK